MHLNTMSQIQLGSFVIVLFIVSGQLANGGSPDDPASEPIEIPTSRGAIQDLFENVRPYFKVPKIFEWRLFKERYHKSYGSTLEEMVRMKRFLARSYDVIIKAVKYYNKQISYYTTITERSDLLDEELRASRNKVLAGKNTEKDGEKLRLERFKRDSNGPGGETESDSEDEHGEPVCEIKDRYTSQQGFRKLNELSIKDGNKRNYTELPIKSQHKTHSLGLMVGRMFFGNDWTPNALKKQAHRTPTGDDVVWVDHRRSGCMHPVGYQGMCGCCYAFALMAFVEWAHCKETGELLKFSEQYLMDCGDMTSNGIYSCDGARTYACGEFVANFGLELAQTYPYRAKSSVCPYESRTPIHSMGHMRVTNMENVVKVDLEVIEDYLEFAPMLISIQSEGDFEFYGGGVFDGRECRRRRQGDHAVLLIGHGRQDGEEYWLIRNSYGKDWGEDGHLKINKNSKCITPAEGLVFGSRDAKGVKVGVAVNENMSKPFNMHKSPLGFALRTVLIG